MANKYRNIGFDYDGVADTGVFEDGAVLITGRPEEGHDEILEMLEDKKPSKIFHFPDGEELDENNKEVKIGIWKARMIKQHGIEKFYEDSEPQIQIIKEMNPKVEIVKVVDGIPQEKMNFVCFTFDMTMLPIACKLEKEGNRVIVGVIQDKKDIALPEEKDVSENPDKKKERLSIFDGMIDKYDADEVLKMMKKVKDKENWFVLTDSNENFKYTEKMLEMGFVNGIFPTEQDRRMEVDRKAAKDFVKEHYPDIKVAEVKSFSKIEEGIQFLNENEDLWVLKSKGDEGETVVPDTEECEMARGQIIAALEEMKTEYEKNGFILEPRIIQPIELTPEILFYNGVPIFTDLDIEVKTIAAGSAVQTGCMMNLVVKTQMEDRINKIAFPEIVHEMAKKRKGIFVWDLSILIDKKGNMFFGEYCSQRFGWDSFPTELAMSADEEGAMIATPFFAALMYKKSPLRKNYGVSVRMLNIGSGGKMINEGVIDVGGEAESCVFLYQARLKDSKIVSTASEYDLGVVVGSDDDLYESIAKCYEYAEMVMFEGKYLRTRSDFQSYDYSASIMKRLDYARSNYLITSPEEDDEKSVGRGLY